MKTSSCRNRSQFVPLALAIGAMLGMGMIASAVQAAESTKKIEIVAKDKEWKVSGYTLAGVPTEIVIRNEDTVTHGFNSSLFNGAQVKLEGDGSLAKGKGPHVYRVDPGKTMVLRFTKSSKDAESMSYAFWCDLHPHMKGEMFVLEVKGESGG